MSQYLVTQSTDWPAAPHQPFGPPPGQPIDASPVPQEYTRTYRFVRQISVGDAAVQLGKAFLLTLLMAALGVALVAFVAFSAQSGSSVVLVPIGAGLVVAIGLFRGLIAVIVAFFRLVAAVAASRRH